MGLGKPAPLTAALTPTEQRRRISCLREKTGEEAAINFGLTPSNWIGWSPPREPSPKSASFSQSPTCWVSLECKLCAQREETGPGFCSASDFKVQMLLREPDYLVHCPCPQQVSQSPTRQNNLKRCSLGDLWQPGQPFLPPLSFLPRREPRGVGLEGPDLLGQLCHFKTLCVMLENLFLLSSCKL